MRHRSFLSRLRGLWPALILLLGGCAGDQEALNLYQEVPPTEVRLPGSALDPVWVKLATDKRPLSQHGGRIYLGTSKLRESDLVEPTYVVLIRSLARDLRLSGVSPGADLRERDQALTLEVSLQTAGAHYGEGLENLLLVLPTSGIGAECAFRVVLKDRDGRRLLDDAFDARSEDSASLLGGLQSAACRALGRAIRKAVDKALPRIQAAPAEYWRRIGQSSSRVTDQ